MLVLANRMTLNTRLAVCFYSSALAIALPTLAARAAGGSPSIVRPGGNTAAAAVSLQALIPSYFYFQLQLLGPHFTDPAKLSDAMFESVATPHMEIHDLRAAKTVVDVLRLPEPDSEALLADLRSKMDLSLSDNERVQHADLIDKLEIAAGFYRSNHLEMRRLQDLMNSSGLYEAWMGKDPVSAAIELDNFYGGAANAFLPADVTSGNNFPATKFNGSYRHAMFRPRQPPNMGVQLLQALTSTLDKNENSSAPKKIVNKGAATEKTVPNAAQAPVPVVKLDLVSAAASGTTILREPTPTVELDAFQRPTFLVPPPTVSEYRQHRVQKLTRKTTRGKDAHPDKVIIATPEHSQIKYRLTFSPYANRQLKEFLTNAALADRKAAVLRTLHRLRENPREGSLRSKKYSPNRTTAKFIGRENDLWESYVENNTPGALRVFWYYGPGDEEIIIVAIMKHPEGRNGKKAPILY